jgi:hypothetical protein
VSSRVTPPADLPEKIAGLDLYVCQTRLNQSLGVLQSIGWTSPVLVEVKSPPITEMGEFVAWRKPRTAAYWRPFWVTDQPQLAELSRTELRSESPSFSGKTQSGSRSEDCPAFMVPPAPVNLEITRRIAFALEST